jgi:hypothetical protein
MMLCMSAFIHWPRSTAVMASHTVLWEEVAEGAMMNWESPGATVTTESGVRVIESFFGPPSPSKNDNWR